MAFSRGATRSWGALALLSAIAAAVQPAIPMNYCASVNTGSTSGNHSIYQSDGLCRDFCSDASYALAIIQSEFCWCSNTLPSESDQVDVGDCDLKCPGFPDDICGGDGLWGYMNAKGTPANTQGAGLRQPPSSTTQARASQNPVTTQTRAIEPHTSEVHVSEAHGANNHASATRISTTSTSPRASSDSTDSMEIIRTHSAGDTTPVPSVQTVTADGTVKTVTATPTAGTSGQNQAAIGSQSNGLSTGAAVGIAVAVVAAIVAMGIIAFCCWRRKKRREEQEMYPGGSPRSSSVGMMNGKAAEAGITPSPSERNGNVEGSWDPVLGRRRSMLMPIDPRIDPAHSGIYSREDNKSRDSINTLRDDQDYSRRVHQPKVLRATNPDPDD